MKSQKLDDHVKDYYGSHTLRDEKLQSLMELTEEPMISRVKLLFFDQKFALVASAVIVVVSLWAGFNFNQNQLLKHNLSQIVAQEIALNHRKHLSLDYNESSLLALNEAMLKLDFDVISSRNDAVRGLDIIGARYCSIQGNIAVQLRLRDESGKHFTLYQTKLTDVLQEHSDSSQVIGQVKIKQWQENNLFLGLAESVDPSF